MRASELASFWFGREFGLSPDERPEEPFWEVT